MRKLRNVIIVFCIFILTISCIKDKYNEDECNPRILVNFDWSGAGPARIEEMISVLFTDEEEHTVEDEIAPEGEYVDFLIPEEYKFTGHTHTEHIYVECETVSLARMADGTYYEPDFFMGGAVTQEILSTSIDQIVTIPMRNQTRPLIIRVILQGRMIDTFSHITGEISGIAVSRHINDGFPPLDNNPLHIAHTNTSVAYDLETEDGSVFTDRKNLLGTDGAVEQLLNLTAHSTTGQTASVQINVSTRMIGFHTENVDEPWVLEFTLSLISEIEIIIIDWTGGYESSLGLK